MSVFKKSRSVIVISQYLVIGGIPCKVYTCGTIMELLQDLVFVVTFKRYQKYPVIIYAEKHLIYEVILCRFHPESSPFLRV
jgi:hypothetical protein